MNKKKLKVYLHPDETWDRHFQQQGRIEKMLHWLIAEMIHTDKDVVDEMRLKAECSQPDIMDILEGKE